MKSATALTCYISVTLRIALHLNTVRVPLRIFLKKNQETEMQFSYTIYATFQMKNQTKPKQATTIKEKSEEKRKEKRLNPDWLIVCFIA